MERRFTQRACKGDARIGTLAYREIACWERKGTPRDWASLGARLVKNPLAMREPWVRSLGWEDPLAKGTATHSSVLTWRIPWTTAMGSQSQTGLSDFHSHAVIGGAERASKVKGSIASWEEGRAEMEEKGRNSWRFRIIKEVGLEAFYWQQMAERGQMGVREEVERRTCIAGEQRGRGRETEKEVGKQIK